jgi:hypothetical protein
MPQAKQIELVSNYRMEVPNTIVDEKTAYSFIFEHITKLKNPIIF